MARLAAKAGDEPSAVAARLKARYAQAAFFSAGVLMPIGYEWGYRRDLHVVETSPAQREHDSDVNISDFVAAINRLRVELPAANVEGAQWRLSAPDAPYVALLRIRFRPSGGGAARPPRPCQSRRRAGDARSRPAARPRRRLSRHFYGSHARRSAARLDARSGRDARASCRAHLRCGAARRAGAGARGVGPERARRRRPRHHRDGLAGDRRRPHAGRSASSARPSRYGPTSSPTATRRSPPRCCTASSGEAEWRRAPMRFVDNDRWAGSFPLERNARYEFTIEAWRDPFAPGSTRSRRSRRPAQPLRLETIEGVRIAEAAARARRPAPTERRSRRCCARLEEPEDGSAAQLGSFSTRTNAGARLPQRRARQPSLATTATLEVIADRLAARFSAWYELFPRSQSGDPNRHGTFDDVIRRLPYVKDLGFDVLYFTPIHPIGRTNRKGRNNALKAEPGDVGSVYAIGSDEGGHDAIHPELGTLRRFPPARGGGARARARDRPRLRHPVLARPPLDQGASGMVRLATRRLDQVRREPAEEIRGHRQRPFLRRLAALAVVRAARRGAVLVRRTACASSASTTRTPSRSRSGSG